MIPPFSAAVVGILHPVWEDTGLRRRSWEFGMRDQLCGPLARDSALQIPHSELKRVLSHLRRNARNNSFGRELTDRRNC